MKTANLVSNFRQLIRQRPALWKVKSTEYTDGYQKNDAYKVLIEKDVDPESDK